MPNVPSRATSASISSRPAGSRPAVGSSSRTNSGSPTSAWASFVRCRMPVEKPPIGRNRASSRPTRSSTSDARCRAARAGRPADLAERADDVGGGLVEGQALVLGHVAEPRSHPDRVVRHRHAAHLDLARSRPGQSEEDAEQRGLARAVRADHADASGRHIGRQRIERRDRAVPLRDLVEMQQGGRGHRRSLSGFAGCTVSAVERRALAPRTARQPMSAFEALFDGLEALTDLGEVVARRVRRRGALLWRARTRIAR